MYQQLDSFKMTTLRVAIETTELLEKLLILFFEGPERFVKVNTEILVGKRRKRGEGSSEQSDESAPGSPLLAPAIRPFFCSETMFEPQNRQVHHCLS